MINNPIDGSIWPSCEWKPGRKLLRVSPVIKRTRWAFVVHDNGDYTQHTHTPTQASPIEANMRCDETQSSVSRGQDGGSTVLTVFKMVSQLFQVLKNSFSFFLKLFKPNNNK